MNEKKIQYPIDDPMKLVTDYLENKRNKINELKVELATTAENTPAYSALKIEIAELTADYNGILKKI